MSSVSALGAAFDAAPALPSAPSVQRSAVAYQAV
jgi:hypothetical protein